MCVVLQGTLSHLTNSAHSLVDKESRQIAMYRTDTLAIRCVLLCHIIIYISPRHALLPAFHTVHSTILLVAQSISKLTSCSVMMVAKPVAPSPA